MAGTRSLVHTELVCSLCTVGIVLVKTAPIIEAHVPDGVRVRLVPADCVRRLALTFGTLLSSQGADAHLGGPLGRSRGNPGNATRCGSRCQPPVPTPLWSLPNSPCRGSDPPHLHAGERSAWGCVRTVPPTDPDLPACLAATSRTHWQSYGQMAAPSTCDARPSHPATRRDPTSKVIGAGQRPVPGGSDQCGRVPDRGMRTPPPDLRAPATARFPRRRTNRPPGRAGSGTRSGSPTLSLSR